MHFMVFLQEGKGDDGNSVHVKEGGSILFSIHHQVDNGLGGPLCTITAFSYTVLSALAYHALTFVVGSCAIVPHGRFESTIQTKLGPKRLVRIVGINKDDTDSTNLAAHFTIEDDTAVAYQPCLEDGATLPDHVIARGVLAFYNGGFDSNVSPTIESIMARRDYHGHGLTRCLFDAIGEWFQREWTLDIRDGARMMQATQLTNCVVDGTPVNGGGDRGGGETGACRGLVSVTDKQLLYETLEFGINPPAEGSIAEIL